VGVVNEVLSKSRNFNAQTQAYSLYDDNNAISIEETRFAAFDYGDMPIYEKGEDTWHTRLLGQKYYELTDHRFNVNVVVSDCKSAEYSGSDVLHYKPVISKVSDYYPFGMAMPERTFSATDGYRYAFQGQEVDNEWTNSDSHYNYEYRVHDARTGRFYSIDPLHAKYAHNSTYAFSENRLIPNSALFHVI
jgi:RHS repeat-associated protein